MSIIQEMVKISRLTIYKLTTRIIIKIVKYLNRYPIIFGGQNVVVQIDEFKFIFDVKSHRGRGPVAPI
ncbi:hypothetical protein GVAV_001691 [Gurleya vavrai]